MLRVVALGGVLVALLSAEPAQASPGCDPLDAAVCLQPWPNDYFTTAADTPTGRRLDLQAGAMPRNVAGKPIEPSDYNRNDGFSPGSPIHTKIAPREGTDPHGHPRRTPAARVQKSEHMRTGGAVTDQCGGGPCRAQP